MQKILLSSLALLFCSSAIASDQEPCSNNTLKGSYIFFANGRNSSKPNSTPIAYAGMTYYDGAGRVTASAEFADKTPLTGNGTYQVFANCRAQIKYTDGRTLTYFLSPQGDDFVWVATSGPIWASSAHRVSENNLIAIKR